MPSVEHSATTPVPVETLWGFVSEIGNWAHHVPGYIRHFESSPDESTWTIKGDVGILSREVEFRVAVTERIEPARVAFTLQGLSEPFNGHGTFEARPLTGDRSAPAPSGPERRRWIDRLVAALWRRFRPARSTVRSAGPSESAPSAPGGGTVFSFFLELNAAGVMAPMINGLIAPLLAPAAADLAGGIVAELEGAVR